MRYRMRAETGVREGHWQRWKTVIVAPAEYLEGTSEGYDAQISYEDIASWYEARSPNDARAAYRARIIRDAITRGRRGGISRLDPIITAFWRMYYADVSLLFPELEMRDPGDKGPNSTWIQFRPARLGPGRMLIHKLLPGRLDLSFSRVAADRVEEFRQRWGTVLARQDVSVEPTGASLAVRQWCRL